MDIKAKEEIFLKIVCNIIYEQKACIYIVHTKFVYSFDLTYRHWCFLMPITVVHFYRC